MTASGSLSVRLLATGLVFLGVAMASIALSLWVAWQLEGGAAAVNEAGRLRMMTYRMALGVATRQADQTELALAFERTLELLRSGDPSRPLFMPDAPQPRAELAQVRIHWAALKAAWQGPEPELRVEQAHALVAGIDRMVQAIEQRLAYWTAVLRAFQLGMAAVAVVSALLMLYASHLLVLEPLRRLGVAMAALRGGRREARVERPGTTEFAELADGFNAMAAQLQLQYAELEEMVRLKTRDLQAQRQRLEALYEVSAFIARADTLEEMARGFVAKLRRIAGADALALRWSDTSQQRYLLLAQEGLPPGFAEQEQCLPAGNCHCGQVPGGAGRPAAGTRLIPIRTGEAPHQLCSQAGFATLLTVPVSLHHRTQGEIDLFYRSDPAQTAPDRALIELLASHLAGGMEGLRAASVEKEAAISNERRLLAQELHDSIAQSLAFLKIQVKLLRGALARGEDESVQRTVAEIETGVLESYADVRELLLHFRTRADSEDFELALRTTLRKFQQQTGIATDIELQGHGVALPGDVQVQVLHIVQEALSNARKHAQATAVRLRVVQAPQWRFEIQDDGIGFHPGAPEDDGHVGLRIMAERAGRIGGLLSVQSRPGAGTTVCLRLAALPAAQAS